MFCNHCGAKQQFVGTKFCNACGGALPLTQTTLPLKASSETVESKVRSQGFTTKQIFGAVGLFLAGVAIMSVLVQSSRNAEKNSLAITSQSLGPAPKPFLSTPDVKVRIARIRPLFERIQHESSFTGLPNPYVSGQLTSAPMLDLLVLEKTWKGLTKEQQIDLTWFVESLIPSVRADAEAYVTIPKKAPLYQRFIVINRELCDECWGITVGNQARRDGHPTFTLERTVVKGDMAWSKKSEYDSSQSASAFRK